MSGIDALLVASILLALALTASTDDLRH